MKWRVYVYRTPIYRYERKRGTSGLWIFFQNPHRLFCIRQQQPLRKHSDDSFPHSAARLPVLNPVPAFPPTLLPASPPMLLSAIPLSLPPTFPWTTPLRLPPSSFSPLFRKPFLLPSLLPPLPTTSLSVAAATSSPTSWQQ